jgi:hypothetical protein
MIAKGDDLAWLTWNCTARSCLTTFRKQRQSERTEIARARTAAEACALACP